MNRTKGVTVNSHDDFTITISLYHDKMQGFVGNVMKPRFTGSP